MKRLSSPGRLAAFVAVALLFAAAALPVSAQQLTGNIFGYVADEQGGRLPGVSVTLTGIGAPRTQTTDARGEYRFVNLSPGEYTVTHDLQGFTKVTKENVQVAVNQTTNTTATLRLASVEAAVTVRGEAAVLDTRKITAGAIVDNAQLQNIPTARDPWVVIQSVPGVQTDRINVGGNESGQQTNYTARGAAGDQNVWNIDGVTITDMGALGSSPTYYDFDSFEEMNVVTGGSDVTQTTPGVQLNMVTKRGTNDFHGSARLFLAQDQWQSSNLPQEAIDQGFRGGNRIDEVQDYGVEMGGPLVRDRLWLWGAYGRNQIDLVTIQGTSDKTTLEDVNAKLNAQIVESLAATVSYTNGDKIKLGRNTGPTRPQPAGWNQSGPTDIYKGELSWVPSSRLFLTGSYSHVEGGFGLLPAGGTEYNSLFIDANGVYQGSYFAYQTERPQDQYGANGSYFFNMGDAGNELKFGFSYRETPVSSLTAWPGNGNYGDYANFNVPVATMTRDAVTDIDLDYMSAWVGDTITLGNLTINAGVRYDQQRGKLNASVTTANPVIPDILPAVSGASAGYPFEWEDFSPRLGLTYALGSEKKTLLRGSYARYADQLGVAPLAFTSASALSGIYIPWTDTNHDNIITRDELDFGAGSTPCGSIRCEGFYGFDPADPGSSVSPNTIDPNLESGKTDEYIIGAEREIVTDLVIGLAYTHRDYDGAFFPRREGLTTADFVPAGDPNEGQTGDNPFWTGDGFVTDGTIVAPIFKLAPGVALPAGLRLENRPGWETSYDGIDLTLQKRLSNRWMARANVTWSDWQQSGNLDGCYDPTNGRGGNANVWPGTGIGLSTVGTCTLDDIAAQPAGAASGAKAEIFLNSSWSFNVGAMYQLPAGFNIAGNFYGREGYPRIRFIRVDPGDGMGPRDVILGKMDDERYDDVFNLDLRAEKIFELRPLQVALSIDVFNVLNEDTVLQRVSRVDLGTYNNISETISPRVVRAGARISF
jgi:hypothetical protein